ncbi:MAG TPA: phosphatase PAP2 family protein [Caldithrix abyssi]|uniref:Phosphatase PAP2 family protein n=1 Tax=Caldithrix abyssi TaxID=187145 RepID=A0A7V4U2P4_CALAY|nr:phosphatase PAP2 family protein [Caldithrix abyssi]
MPVCNVHHGLLNPYANKKIKPEIFALLPDDVYIQLNLDTINRVERVNEWIDELMGCWSSGVRNCGKKPDHFDAMKKQFIYTIIIFSFLSRIGFAQSWEEIRQDMIATGDVGIGLWDAMIHPSKDTQMAYLIGGSVVALSFLADRSIADFSQMQQSPAADKLFGIDKYYGSVYTVAGSGALYLAGFFSGNQKIKDMGLHTAQALLYTGILTIVTKELFGRARPYTDLGPYHFSPFSFSDDRRSFFSGHTSTAFAFSTVMAGEIDNIFWQIFWYGAATLTAGARIYHNKHWFSDVVAGALVGYAVGRFVVNYNGNTTVGASVSPEQQVPQIQLTIRF